jgi:zinc ribbon protein
VPDFCTCGAQLPPDARFCHKCGKPQYDYPNVEQESIEPPLLPPPAVLAPLPEPAVEISFHNRIAVRVGFLAALAAVLLFMAPLPFPIFRLLLAFGAAGFLAVFIYSRRTGQVLSIRSGARMGWITGIFSFTIITVLFTVLLVAISSQGGLAAFFREHRDQLAASGAQVDTFLQALDDPSALAGGLVFLFMMLFFILTLLPTLGGALGAKLLARQRA